MFLVGAFDGYRVDVQVTGDCVKHFVVHVLGSLAELGDVSAVDTVRFAVDADAFGEFFVADAAGDEVALGGFLGALHEGFEGLAYANIFRVVLCVGFPDTQLYFAHVGSLSI